MFLNKLERKYGKYAIQNLSVYLIAAYIIGYFIFAVNKEWYAYLTFDPYEIFHGQIWRLFTWILTFPNRENIIYVAIMMFFYYSIGTLLEKTWGTFRYNVYIFSGMIFTVVAGLLLYFVLAFISREPGNHTALNMLGMEIGEFGHLLAPETVQQLVGALVGECVSTYYIFMSILLACAATYPELEVMLYFFIPVKMKWFGLVYAALCIFDAVMSNWGTRVMIVASLLNFVIFFFTTRNYNRMSPKEIKRKSTYKKRVREAQRNSTYENGARHKCAICGRTELDDPNLVFRFCSKCKGGKEYCQEHLFTHEHR